MGRGLRPLPTLSPERICLSPFQGSRAANPQGMYFCSAEVKMASFTQVSFCSAKMLLAARMSPLRITIRGKRPPDYPLGIQHLYEETVSFRPSQFFGPGTFPINLLLYAAQKKRKAARCSFSAFEIENSGRAFVCISSFSLPEKPKTIHCHKKGCCRKLQHPLILTTGTIIKNHYTTEITRNPVISGWYGGAAAPPF